MIKIALTLLLSSIPRLSFGGPPEIRLAIKPECSSPYRVLASPSGKGGYELSYGDAVKITLKDGSPPVDAVFLGRFVGPDGKATDGAFYEAGSDRMHFLPVKDLILQRADGTDIDLAGTFPLVKPLKQEGPTCSSFADINCLLTIRERTGGKGVSMSTEGQRLALLTRSLADTYGGTYVGYSLQQVHHYVVDKNFVTKREPLPTEKEKHKEAIIESLEQGWPVIITYDTRGWTPQVFKTIQYDGGSPKEVGGHGQWLPMKKKSLWSRLRQALGMSVTPDRHAVVALGIVEGPKGSRKMLVLDSNWEFPVLWDLSELNHGGASRFTSFKFSWEEKKSPETGDLGGP